ncbi:hypothetical protein B9Z19DRAFT_1064984 [Tuber borchii]|uniref:Uncharacterized protein n=1 Tax=Tuber borchii TaxID=42251 RepID=A0A2T6ZSU6_TUBBO|nr:hypothetical protein B9Z19DRAFT_1064984 [Tuber borchii]
MALSLSFSRFVPVGLPGLGLADCECGRANVWYCTAIQFAIPQCGKEALILHYDQYRYGQMLTLLTLPAQLHPNTHSKPPVTNPDSVQLLLVHLLDRAHNAVAVPVPVTSYGSTSEAWVYRKELEELPIANTPEETEKKSPRRALQRLIGEIR